MFDTMKFGKALSTLRKQADMTQNEVADRLNLSRQAISKYERGESFPDISILVMIAELFNVTLDELINYGEPTKGESAILENVAKGNADIIAENIADVVNLAPLLKPSILTKLSHQFEKQGIDISDIITLAEYLNDVNLDADQIYFVNQIIEYIVRNGVMKDMSVLQEAPFTDRGSIVEVFTDISVWLGIKSIIDIINANAAA